MASILGFKIEEKLAIMQIIIEIVNHYSERFPNPHKLLQTFSKYLELPTVNTGAYLMSLSNAQTVVVKHVRDGGRSYDFENMLRTMLHASHYGVFSKHTNRENRTPQQLITEWHYIFYSLLKGYIRPIEARRIAFAVELLRRPTPLSHCMALEDKVIETPTVEETYRSNTHSKEITGIIRRELKEELRREIKEELHCELKEEIIKELKELLRKEVKDELHSGMKNFVHENFNETLYKDL